VLDCRNEELSNWLMFVKRARTSAEQNVMVYQEQDDIYFVTCKDIDPGTELLYWYARDYAKMLGTSSVCVFARGHTLNEKNERMSKDGFLSLFSRLNIMLLRLEQVY